MTNLQSGRPQACAAKRQRRQAESANAPCRSSGRRLPGQPGPPGHNWPTGAAGACAIFERIRSRILFQVRSRSGKGAASTPAGRAPRQGLPQAANSCPASCGCTMAHAQARRNNGCTRICKYSSLFTGHGRQRCLPRAALSASMHLSPAHPPYDAVLQEVAVDLSYTARWQRHYPIHGRVHPCMLGPGAVEARPV